MNYTEITQLALDYADRTDADTQSNMDNFLRIVESKVNRWLRTMDMTVSTDVAIVAGQEEYSLPTDWGGARLMSWQDGAGRRVPIRIITPEAFEYEADAPIALVRNPNLLREILAYIEDDKIHIYPTQDDGNLHFKYYLAVPALTSLAPNNWLSDAYPDCYAFGLVTEIKAYVKNEEARALWEGRFDKTLTEIQVEDQSRRWAGQPLQQRPA